MSVTNVARQLRPMQRAVGHHDEPGPNAVASVRANHPVGAYVVPFEAGDLGLEARIPVEIEMTVNRPAVLEDLGCVRVLLDRDVADPLQQWQVDVRLDIAHGTRYRFQYQAGVAAAPLIIGVGTQTFIALGPILVAESVRVEGKRVGIDVEILGAPGAIRVTVRADLLPRVRRRDEL